MEYDTNPIRVHTEYNDRQFKDFIAFSMFRSKGYRFGKIAMLIIIPILLVILALLCIDDLYYYDYMDPSNVTLIILLVVLYVLLLLLFYYVPRKSYQEAKKLFSGGADFTLRSNDFTVVHNNGECTGSSSLRYELLYKVYETKTMFYFFITSGQAYLLSKNGFLSGSPEELRAVLQNRLGKKKYKLCD